MRFKFGYFGRDAAAEPGLRGTVSKGQGGQIKIQKVNNRGISDAVKLTFAEGL
jgi:hypothetical protein